MQSLLAHYFESNAIDPKVFEPPHFEAERVHALNNPQSETRAISPADFHVTHATDAAFVPVAPATAPSSPSSLVAQPDWPAPARALIDSLMRENEALREQLQQQALHLQSAQGMAVRRSCPCA